MPAHYLSPRRACVPQRRTRFDLERVSSPSVPRMMYADENRERRAISADSSVFAASARAAHPIFSIGQDF
jgi:hypothetical protein